MAALYPAIMDFKVGGGSHMWDIRLKDYFRLLYVCIYTSVSYTSAHHRQWLNVSSILMES